MAKNYIMLALFDLGNDKFHKFEEMAGIAVESYRQNLEGPFEVFALEGKAGKSQDIMKRVFQAEDELYHKEPCNILRIGLDTLCIRPCQVFGRFGRLMLFSPASCKPHRSLPWHSYRTYMNGIYYIPAGVPDHIWDVGREYYHKWDDTIYDYSVYLYNQMFYSQGPDSDMIRLIDNRLNFNMPVDGPPSTNLIPVSEAQVIHLHSSRNVDLVLEKMRAWKSDPAGFVNGLGVDND